MKTRNHFHLGICAVLLSLSPFALAATSPETVAPELSYEDVEAELQKLDTPFLRDGVVIDLQLFDNIQPGVSAQQVREQLGEPVDTTRGIGRTEWDYNLKLRTGELRRDFLVCQYKVAFSADNTVETAVWRRPQCQELASGR